MSLKPCHECGNQVSEDSKTCPKCGAKQKKPTSRVTWAIAGLFAFAIANSIFNRTSTPANNAIASPPKIEAPAPAQAAPAVAQPEPEKLTKEDIRKRDAINLRLDVEKRESHAKKTEINFLSDGKDVHVTLQGKNKTTLKLTYILMTRPLVFQIQNNQILMSQMKSLGFQKIIMTDGYNESWTIDL